MNTQEIAEKLVVYNREGKFPAVYHDLYVEDMVSIEMPGAPNEVVQGIEAVMKKAEWWEENFEMHEVKVSEPLVSDDHFAVTFWMHTTNKKTGEEEKMSELAVYTVAEGKIVQEQFFYGQ